MSKTNFPVLNKVQKDIIVDLFNKKANTWSEKYSSQLSSRLLAFKSMLLPFKTTHKTLLDVGCATGTMLKMAYELGFDIKGIDVSPKMVEICKKNLMPFISDNKIQCITLEDFIVTDSKFDVIICSSVFEYLDYPEIYIELFYKILNNNGVVLITIPNTRSLTRFVEKTIKICLNFLPFLIHTHSKLKSFSTYLQTSKNRYSENEFISILSTNKFNVKSKVYISKNQITENNDFLNSNLILYVLEKRNDNLE